MGRCEHQPMYNLSCLLKWHAHFYYLNHLHLSIGTITPKPSQDTPIKKKGKKKEKSHTNYEQRIAGPRKKKRGLPTGALQRKSRTTWRYEAVCFHVSYALPEREPRFLPEKISATSCSQMHLSVFTPLTH